MSKPLIGVTSSDRLLFQTDYFSGERASYTLAGITTAVQNAGGIPVIIPIHDEALSKDYLEKIDGLLLTGGADVSPEFYGQEPQPLIGRFDPRRDRREIALFEEAAERKTPIFAICRGMQLINAALGGDLYQDVSYNPDITVQHSQTASADIPVHSITVKEGTHFETLIPDQTMVNSIHHQTLKHVANDLDVVAWSADGTVEAIEAINDKYNIVGVQYHPENLVDSLPVHRRLFDDFIDRVNAKREA